jgi:hypothetical protein
MPKLIQHNEALNMLEELAQLAFMRSSDIILLKRATQILSAIEEHDIQLGYDTDQDEVANDNDGLDPEDYQQYGEFNE